MPNKKPSFCPSRQNRRNQFGKGNKCKRPQPCKECRQEHVDQMVKA
jgi:hypothetical protein